MRVTIRVLSFDGCPNAAPTEELVRRIAAQLDVDLRLETLIVATHEDAVRHRFLGSPTVQIGGHDIEPEARVRTDVSLGCRLYGASGVPPAEMIAAAIREAVM